MSKIKANETFFSVQADKRVFKGEEVEADSKIAQAHPEKFGVEVSTKKTSKVEEPKEEILTEEPVAALEVEVKDEEVTEEVTEEKTKRKRAKK